MLAFSALQGEDELLACAGIMVTSQPWLTLGLDLAACLRVMRAPGRECWVARAQAVQFGAPGAPGAPAAPLAGFVILNMNGPLGGYIQTLAVAEHTRGQGVGTALLAHAEQRIFATSANAFICVSSFNPDARRLYERLGYRLVGEMPDFLLAGHAELLLRKSRGPILGPPKPT
jgi:ribosomal protein S18 acetylase RimI-like enzyme